MGHKPQQCSTAGGHQPTGPSGPGLTSPQGRMAIRPAPAGLSAVL